MLGIFFMKKVKKDPKHTFVHAMEYDTEKKYKINMEDTNDSVLMENCSYTDKSSTIKFSTILHVYTMVLCLTLF